MLAALAQWRQDKGLEETVYAVAAATAAARDLPGDGSKWEKLNGALWDDDEHVYNIRVSGANTFAATCCVELSQV